MATTVFTVFKFTAGDTKSFYTLSSNSLPDKLLVGLCNGILVGPLVGSFDGWSDSLIDSLLLPFIWQLLA